MGLVNMTDSGKFLCTVAHKHLFREILFMAMQLILISAFKHYKEEHQLILNNLQWQILLKLFNSENNYEPVFLQAISGSW